MASLPELANRPADWFESGTATGVVTVTRVSPGAVRRIRLDTVQIVLAGPATTGGAVTLTGAQSGAGGPSSTTLMTLAAGMSGTITLPLNLTMAVGAAVTLTVPAAGVAVSATIIGTEVSA